MTYYDDWLKHHGVKGMKWGVRKDRVKEGVRQGVYKVGAKLNPRETKYTINRALNKVNDMDNEVAKIANNQSRSDGVLTTNPGILKTLNKTGIEKHKNTKYDNIDDTDIKRLKLYTDAAVYSRTINSYLATGIPEHVSDKAKALKDTIRKNSISDTTVYRSMNLKFSTKGLNTKLENYGEEELSKVIDQIGKNFKGKTMKENRVYSTSTSPEFAIDTWRKVNPTAAKTYNCYMIIDCKGTPGLLADGRTTNGKKLVNTRSNQEAILAPNSMTYKSVKWDKDRKMFAVYMDAK